ncbi:asparaginase [Piscinibacter sp. SJAQ100]|uniref:Asparaginase n=1 Tax=Aquariibacter albus TaxID=2759899 RepID=A0A839HNR1_9BURK|nr:asparaginase [Aquariibacter albus]
MDLPSPAPTRPPADARVVVLGTGGTIAGLADRPDQPLVYRAAQQGVDVLLAALPELQGLAIEHEQVAQLDSKDMGAVVWQPLLARCAAQLARPEVSGLVLTHGTDTLEESAWLLHRVLAPRKPLLLTAAMRPASARGADGPVNLLDALRLAADPAAPPGVALVFGGELLAPRGLRKLHPQRLSAFAPGPQGRLGELYGGRLRRPVPPPGPVPVDEPPLGLDPAGLPPAPWPRVEVLASHADADGALVDVLCAHRPADGRPLAGLIVAGTGNGTLHRGLAAALARARAQGCVVWRTSRLPEGEVIDPEAVDAGGQPLADLARPMAPDAPLPCIALSPWQARVELVLRLLAQPGGRRPG